MLLFILCNHPIHFLTHIILNTSVLRHGIDTTRILSVVSHYRTIVSTTWHPCHILTDAFATLLIRSINSGFNLLFDEFTRQGFPLRGNFRRTGIGQNGLCILWSTMLNKVRKLLSQVFVHLASHALCARSHFTVLMAACPAGCILVIAVFGTGEWRGKLVNTRAGIIIGNIARCGGFTAGKVIGCFFKVFRRLTTGIMPTVMRFPSRFVCRVSRTTSST